MLTVLSGSAACGLISNISNANLGSSFRISISNVLPVQFQCSQLTGQKGLLARFEALGF